MCFLMRPLYFHTNYLLLHIKNISMSIIVFTILLLLGAYCAGLLGSLTGLGGGVIVIPLLTLVI